MKKNIFKFLYQIWDEAPKLVFWSIIVTWLFSKIKSIKWYISVPIIIFSFLSIIILLCKWYKKTKQKILQNRLTKRYLPQNKSLKAVNKVDLLLNNVFDQKTVDATYKYAESYATSWEPDSFVSEITFYIHLENEREITKEAQIFIISKLRKEKLIKYIYMDSHTIEEGKQSDLEGYKIVSKINSFQFWQEAIKKSIINVASDIEKSDKLRIQICSDQDYLSIYFYFELEDREWVKRYKLTNNTLINDEETTVYQFKVPIKS